MLYADTVGLYHVARRCEQFATDPLTDRKFWQPAKLLARLAGPFNRGDWADIVQAAIERQGALLESAPAAVPSMLFVQLLSEHGADLLLPADDPLSAVRTEFVPLATFITAPPDAVPLAAGRDAGRAYLCQHGTCQLPASTVEQLHSQLARLHSLQPQ